jgi:hypothetical protein
MLLQGWQEAEQQLASAGVASADPAAVLTKMPRKVSKVYM